MTDKELETWIRQYGKDIYSFCMHITHNAMDAEELYQDVWLQVLKNLPRVEKDGNIKSYCLGVAVRLWKNKRRKLAWRSRIAPEIPLESEEGTEYFADTGAGPEEICMEKQIKKAVWDAVNRLPEKYRLPVLLFYMEKLTAAQTGEALGLPEGTVKSRLSTARHLLAKELEDLHEK